MAAINIIGLGVLAIFLLFIFQKKNKGKSDYLLILINVLLAAFLFSDIWIKQGLNSTNYIFQNLINFYLFPSLLSYGMILINRGHEIRKGWWWLGSYAIAFTVFIFIDFYFLNDYTAEKLQVQYERPSFIYHFFHKTHAVFIIVISLWFLKQLKKYQQIIKDYYSFIEPIRLIWLRNFMWFYLLLNLLILGTFMMYNLGYIADINSVYLTIYIALVISLFYLSYNGIRQYTIAELYQSQEQSRTNQLDKERPFSAANSSLTPKYQSSSLAEDDMEKLYQHLIQLFEEDHIYCEPHLKIQLVANHLNATTHNISQTINVRAGMPFYDFVNGYRVLHLKKLLTAPENKQFTILAWGLESGFNSKASLNRIFKQHVGQSPREFQKTHLIK